jgi:hypothetical protein
MLEPRDLAAVAAVSGRDFLRGWIEGRSRFRQAATPGDIRPSWFDRRTLGRAASNAAVAFYLALDGDD